MLGSTLALAAMDGTPAGRKHRAEIMAFYKQLNSKVPSKPAFYGNSVMLSTLHNSMSKMSKGDPLSPLTDIEENALIPADSDGGRSISHAKAILHAVGSSTQHTRLLYNVLKRRVKAILEDDAIEKVIKWYTPQSYTLVSFYDPDNPLSMVASRYVALHPIWSDLAYSLGVLFYHYKKTNAVLPPFLSNPAAVTRITARLKKAYTIYDYYDLVGVKKLRLEFNGKSYLHPVITVKPSDKLLDGLEQGGENIYFNGTNLTSNSEDRFNKMPEIGKIYRKLDAVSKGDYSGEFPDEDAAKDFVTKGREVELPESLERLVDEILSIPVGGE